MKKLFQAIRKKDNDIVKQLIQKKPELVNCTAKQPPKKDDGQSPLQVALKTGNFEIAEYLINMGANLNFIEGVFCCNAWRTPVIHDAINAAVMNSRCNTNNSITGFKVFSTKEEAEKSYQVLEKMISMGADVNGLDSYGNSGLWRFCLQANQILPRYDYTNDCECDDRIFTDELHLDLLKILKLLCINGADFEYVSPNTKTNVREFYRKGALSILLTETFE